MASVRGLRPPGELGWRSLGAAGSAALPGRRGEGRPRYLEDEGGPRPGSHLRGAPPARPHPRPKSNPTRPEPRREGRRARGQRPGRRSQHPELGRGSVPGAAARGGARRKSTESSSLVQKWRRAESLPLRKRGRGSRGRGARAGGGTRGTRAPGARAAPARRLSLGQRSGPLSADQWLGGEEREAGGEDGEGGRGGGRKGRRGGQAGGAATLSSHLPKALQRTLTPRLTSITTTAMQLPGGGGNLPPLRPRRSSHLQKSLPLGPRHPGHHSGEGAWARRAAQPSPPERWAPGPPLLSAPARSAPRNSRPANFKGPPGTSKRADRPAAAASALTIDPRARSAARPRRRPGQGPGPGPRIGSQWQPRAPPGQSRRRGTWGVARQGRECGETTILGLERDPPARRGERRAPPPLLCKRSEWASAPAAAAPGPSGPRPARLSTQVLFPAVTPRTKCPPGASNKNCAVDLTVHFKGASRAHGPEREVRAGRAPTGPPRPHRPSSGPSGSLPPSWPGLCWAGPLPAPGARDAAGRDLAPGPRGALFEAALLGPRLHPPPFTAKLSAG